MTLVAPGGEKVDSDLRDTALSVIFDVVRMDLAEQFPAETISGADVLTAVIQAWMRWGHDQGIVRPSEEVIITGCAMLSTEAMSGGATVDEARRVADHCFERGWAHVVASQGRQPDERPS